MRSILIPLLLVVGGCPGDKLGGIADCETVVGTCPKGGGKSWWSTEADGCWRSAEVQIDGSWVNAESGIAEHASDSGPTWLDAWINCPIEASSAQGELCSPCYQ